MNSITANLLTQVFAWRRDSDIICKEKCVWHDKHHRDNGRFHPTALNNLGRRFVTELAIIAAVPAALIELTARAIFQTLRVAIAIAALPFAYILDFKIDWLESNSGLFETAITICQLPLHLLTQPFSSNSEIYGIQNNPQNFEESSKSEERSNKDDLYTGDLYTGDDIPAPPEGDLM